MNKKSVKLSGTCFTGGSPDFMAGLGVSAGLAGPVGFAPTVSSTGFLDNKMTASGYPCSDQRSIKLQTMS